MSTQDEVNPLVQALRRKTNYQAERIDELEESITELQTDVDILKAQLEGDDDER